MNLKNLFREPRTTSPQPEPAAPAAPPAPQSQPSAPTVFYHAVSNCDFQGLPLGYTGLSADTRTFRTFEEARAWLVDLRCGGTIYNSRDDRTHEVLPGADA